MDGARHLRGLGLLELACPVAHHSGAHIEADHRGLADHLAEFRRPTGPVADALTYCRRVHLDIVPERPPR